MFSNYKELAKEYYVDEDAPVNKVSLSYQANRYYSLINYLNNITEHIEYDYKNLVDKCKSDIFEKFNDAIKNGSVTAELNMLINNSNDNRYYSYSSYGPSYQTARFYSKEMANHNNGLSDIKSEISKHVSDVVCEILKKDCYLNYKVNETEEDVLRSKYQDKVLNLNRKIQHIDSNFMYRMHYTYVNDTYKKATFNKEITHIDPVRYRPNIIVDKNWFDTVGDKGFQILEYQGSRAFTISAEEYSSDSNRTLYFVKVLQLTGTRVEMQKANWHNVMDRMDKIVKVRDLILSVSNQDDKIWALGADETWAERTMRARQKRTMMKGLNI